MKYRLVIKEKELLSENQVGDDKFKITINSTLYQTKILGVIPE